LIGELVGLGEIVTVGDLIGDKELAEFKDPLKFEVLRGLH
jgi:hypothetical protein